MHIHNGLKIGQPLCNRISLLFALIGISGAQIGVVEDVYYKLLFHDVLCWGQRCGLCVCLFLVSARLRVLSVCLCHLRVSVAAVQHVDSERRTHVPLPYTLQHGTLPNPSHGIAQARKISTREAMNEGFK